MALGWPFLALCQQAEPSHASFLRSQAIRDSLVIVGKESPGYKLLQDCPETDFLIGKSSSVPKDFVKVEPKYANKEVYLDAEVYEAFKRMSEDMKREGLELTIISGYRSFNHQKLIWERKWSLYEGLADSMRVREILTFSSMPGISRHHWGTDLDINFLENHYFESGYGLKVYRWLSENAMHYGFYQPYGSKQNGRSGFEEEKWHWSYYPLANEYLNCYKSDNQIVEKITGFHGSAYYQLYNLLDTYVQGVDRIE